VLAPEVDDLGHVLALGEHHRHEGVVHPLLHDRDRDGTGARDLARLARFRTATHEGGVVDADDDLRVGTGREARPIAILRDELGERIEGVGLAWLASPGLASLVEHLGGTVVHSGRDAGDRVGRSRGVQVPDAVGAHPVAERPAGVDPLVGRVRIAVSRSLRATCLVLQLAERTLVCAVEEPTFGRRVRGRRTSDGLGLATRELAGPQRILGGRQSLQLPASGERVRRIGRRRSRRGGEPVLGGAGTVAMPGAASTTRVAASVLIARPSRSICSPSPTSRAAVEGRQHPRSRARTAALRLALSSLIAASSWQENMCSSVVGEPR